MELPIIPDGLAMAERDIERRFDEAWPKLLGLLCDAAVAALKHLPTVQIAKLPRMADFTRWVYAAAAGGALPFTGEEFLASYEENRKTAFIDTMEAAPFARVVQRLMQGIPVFEGTAEELRLALMEKFKDEIGRFGWANSNQKLGDQLKDMASVIRESGIDVERFRESGGASGGQRRRIIRLTAKTEVGQPVAAVFSV